MKCDFCNRDNAIGVFASHVPISLGYCQECLDAENIRTRHNTHHNWVMVGDSYLNNKFTVYFNGKYLTIKEYCENLKPSDVDEMYIHKGFKPFKLELKERIEENGS